MNLSASKLFIERRGYQSTEGNSTQRGRTMTGYPATRTVVDMAEVNITGNVIPHAWYKNVTFPSGKPNLNAIIILAEIVYWYRPVEVRDEATGEFKGYTQRFKADKLQRSYQSFADQFGISKKQVREAMDTLEELGVVSRELRNISTDEGLTLSNVLFIGINVEALKTLSAQVVDTVSQGNRYYPAGHDLLPSRAIPIAPQGDTYTESTTENTTEIIIKREQKNLVKGKATGEASAEPVEPVEGALAPASSDKDSNNSSKREAAEAAELQEKEDEPFEGRLTAAGTKQFFFSNQTDRSNDNHRAADEPESFIAASPEIAAEVSAAPRYGFSVATPPEIINHNEDDTASRELVDAYLDKCRERFSPRAGGGRGDAERPGEFDVELEMVMGQIHSSYKEARHAQVNSVINRWRKVLPEIAAQAADRLNTSRVLVMRALAMRMRDEDWSEAFEKTYWSSPEFLRGDWDKFINQWNINEVRPRVSEETIACRRFYNNLEELTRTYGIDYTVTANAIRERGYDKLLDITAAE